MIQNKWRETIYVIKSLFLFSNKLNILAYLGFVVLYSPVAKVLPEPVSNFEAVRSLLKQQSSIF